MQEDPASRAGLQTRFFLFFWSLAAFVSGDFYLFHHDIRADILILAASTISLFYFHKKSVFVLAFFVTQVLIPYCYLPLLGNNVTLRLIVSVFLFLNWAILVVRRRQPIDFAENVAAQIPALKLATLLVYWISAFHKLNEDFLNPETTCVRTLLKNDLISSSLKAVRFPDWLIYAGISATFLLEAVLPFFLFFARFRFLAALLLILGHAALGGQFMDFSLTQIGLLCLFLPEEFLLPVYNYLCANASRGRRWLAFALVLSLPIHFPEILEITNRKLVEPGTFLLLFACLFLVLMIKTKGFFRNVHERKNSHMVPGWLGIAMLLVILGNGLSPYLGLKTISTFSMYSNLRVQNGWNHFILSENFLRVFPEAADLVEIKESDDPFLNGKIIQKSKLITRFELARFLRLSQKPVHLLYRPWNAGTGWSDDVSAILAQVPISWWKHKLMGYKPVIKADVSVCEW